MTGMAGKTSDVKIERIKQLSAQGLTQTVIAERLGLAQPTVWYYLKKRQPSGEEIFREMLWLSHGHEGMYGDDGEMQCSQCLREYGFFDWKRTPAAEIQRKIQAANLKKSAQAANLEEKQPDKCNLCGSTRIQILRQCTQCQAVLSCWTKKAKA